MDRHRHSDHRRPGARARVGPSFPRMPIWIIPVLVAIPIWGFVYIGAFGVAGQQQQRPRRARRHDLRRELLRAATAPTARVPSGPRLNGGEVIQEWPNLADHIKWVHTGGSPYIGGTIGALHIPVPPNNVMPAFGMDHGGPLTDAQIQLVVCYERVNFGGEKETAVNCPGFTG